MEIVRIAEVLGLLELVSLAAAAVAGLIAYRKLGRGFRYLSLYLLMVTVVEVLAKLHLYVWTDVNNLYLLHIYTPLEFLLLSLVYREWLNPGRKGKKLFNVYIGGVTAGIVYYSIYELGLPHANDPVDFRLYSKALVNGSIITYSSLLVIKVIRKPVLFLEKDSFVLYVNSAMLLYFSGSFVVFLAITYLMRNDISETIYFWLINMILTFVLHTVCLFALWRKNRSR